MRSLTPRLSRRSIFRGILIAIIVIGLVTVATAGYVYYQAIKTFEVRRVALPTRIFTDMMPLRPGEIVSSDDLLDKLSRLGYRETPNPVQPGEFTQGGGTFRLMLRPFRHPSGNRPQQLVELTISKNEIATVTSGGQPVETAALEPEQLTSILSDQLENRRPVTLDQVPQRLVDSVVVTEDVRFWHHPGVDPIGMFRAIFRNVRAGGVAEGASTLTQQLVKNYYLSSERTFKRKIVEAFMAVILDAKYSKREILEAYLNDIYLGRNRSISIIGVGEAARFYFGKPVSELTYAESALLAGMIRGPNNYSPFTAPDRATARRNIVLGLMKKYDKISDADYQRALTEPLPKKPFRQRGGLNSIPYYVDLVLMEMKRDYGIDDVKGRGLSIYTAIDLNMQNEASQTIASGIENLEKSSRRLRNAESPLQGVLISVDVPSGEVRALVGGRNYDSSQFNRALAAQRQVGSLFKPFVYASAFEPSLSNQNITPATLVNDSRFVLKRKFSKDWSPANYEGRYHGVVTVREALEQSMNVASVRLGLSVGIDKTIQAAHALGIDSELEDVPSLILGAVGIRPIEMAEAYTTLARMGSRVPLHAVRFVTNDRGDMVGGGLEVKPVQVFPARDVYLTVHLMEGVVDRGTAAAVRSLGFRKIAAGKTGTTNDLRDAWFIGFTPQTLALTWIGFDDNRPVGLSGGQGAVPLWVRFMRDAAGAQPNRDFPVPSGIVFAPMDESTGGLATPFCPANLIVNEAFKSGTEPTNPCPLHSQVMPPVTEMPTMTDTNGMPITTDSNGIPPPTTTYTNTPPPPPPPPTSTTSTEDDSVLRGGTFKTQTDTIGAPPPTDTTGTQPPPVERN